MKNRINKNNRTVIRKENTKGNFTTVHNSILKDNRLSGNAFKLLVCILSNSDDFAFSPKYYQNETGLSESTYLRTMKELVEFGYAKVYKINEKANINHYMFSEFGNLNNNTEESKANPEVTQNNPEVTQNNPELCTLFDIEELKIDIRMNSIFQELTNQGYTVDYNTVLDLILTKLTKSDLEKIDDIKLKKIMIKYSTKPEKITDKEIKEMVIAKGEGLTKIAIEGLTTRVIQRYNDNPQWVKEDISQCILRNISTFKKPITSNQD